MLRLDDYGRFTYVITRENLWFGPVSAPLFGSENFGFPFEKKQEPGFYIDRVAGGHRHHRHLGGSFIAPLGRAKAVAKRSHCVNNL